MHISCEKKGEDLDKLLIPSAKATYGKTFYFFSVYNYDNLQFSTLCRGKIELLRIKSTT